MQKVDVPVPMSPSMQMNVPLGNPPASVLSNSVIPDGILSVSALKVLDFGIKSHSLSQLPSDEAISS
jgi:hypothetical protein